MISVEHPLLYWGVKTKTALFFFFLFLKRIKGHRKNLQNELQLHKLRSYSRKMNGLRLLSPAAYDIMATHLGESGLATMCVYRGLIFQEAFPQTDRNTNR